MLVDEFDRLQVKNTHVTVAKQLARNPFFPSQDLHSSAWFSFLASTRWFGIWLDWTVVAFLLCVVASFLLMDDGSLGGDVGVVLLACMQLTG